MSLNYTLAGAVDCPLEIAAPSSELGYDTLGAGTWAMVIGDPCDAAYAVEGTPAALRAFAVRAMEMAESLLARQHAVAAETRGSLSCGYDDDRIEDVLGRLNAAYGTRLVCVWDHHDAHGFAGDATLCMADDEGRLCRLDGDLPAWLTLPPNHPDAPDSPGTPEQWRGEATDANTTPPLSQDALNHAKRDLRRG